MAARREGELRFDDANAKKNQIKRGREKRRDPGQDFVVEPVRKKRWPWITVILLLVAVAGISFAVLRDNHLIRVTGVTVSDGRIPEAFDGFRILQLSDFNGRSFGTDNRRLIEEVKNLKYDIVLLTGDFLNASGDPDSFAPARQVIEALAESGKPIYYVLGENDVAKDFPDAMKARDGWNMCIEKIEGNPVAEALDGLGAKCVYPLTVIESGDSRIFLTGITYYEKLFDTYNFDSDKDFSICVTHAPVAYDVDKRLASVNRYSFREVDFDMSISGHTLGGQYRLPLLKTVYLEGYGLFPQESVAYGLHKTQGRWNFITAGLGVKSGFRLCNRPEVALIELRCAKN